MLIYDTVISSYIAHGLIYYNLYHDYSLQDQFIAKVVIGNFWYQFYIFTVWKVIQMMHIYNLDNWLLQNKLQQCSNRKNIYTLDNSIAPKNIFATFAIETQIITSPITVSSTSSYIQRNQFTFFAKAKTAFC